MSGESEDGLVRGAAGFFHFPSIGGLSCSRSCPTFTQLSVLLDIEEWHSCSLGFFQDKETNQHCIASHS